MRLSFKCKKILSHCPFYKVLLVQHFGDDQDVVLKLFAGESESVQDFSHIHLNDNLGGIIYNAPVERCTEVC